VIHGGMLIVLQSLRGFEFKTTQHLRAKSPTTTSRSNGAHPTRSLYYHLIAMLYILYVLFSARFHLWCVTLWWFMWLKLYAHGMRPIRFLSASVLFRDVTSFSDAFGTVCIRVEPVSILTDETHFSDSLLLERGPDLSI